nr:glycine cleavage system aminomethyltransferase GcvT [Candidatus Dadabacteria bacterium]NIQ13189.1 glycine cleavage system aminomethyltransferase GcvT [Candidatus Dadabacteria bacterium]
MAKTTLYDTHKKNGARIIDFAGWEMPVQFEGVIAEHNAVRNSAGIFDVSHMGEIEVIGKEAIKFCNWITTNNVEKLKENKAQYTIICNENGGVIDDVILYKFSDEHFLFCANASNTIKVNQWILDNSINYGVEIVDKSNQYSQFAVQGPNSIKILNKVFHYDLNDIPRFSFELLKFNNSSVIAARTGYTGEDGFELFITNAYAVELWNRIYDAGKIHGLKYCGLGSRDTLRIEMGYPLYGHEIDENISPLEAGLERY